VNDAPARARFGKELRLRGRKEFDRVFREAPCSVLSLKTPRKETHRAAELLALDESDHGDGMADVYGGCVVHIAEKPATKEAAFRLLTEAFIEGFPSFGSVEELEAAFWEREQVQNTAVGEGVAFPHATLRDAERTRLGVLIFKESIDYQAPGSSGVDLCFATVGPPEDRNTHLLIMSALSAALLKADLGARLRKAESVEEARGILRESLAG